MTLSKGIPNMILVKVIIIVNVENHFLKFTKYITFTRIMLGIGGQPVGAVGSRIDVKADI